MEARVSRTRQRGTLPMEGVWRRRESNSRPWALEALAEPTAPTFVRADSHLRSARLLWRWSQTRRYPRLNAACRA